MNNGVLKGLISVVMIIVLIVFSITLISWLIPIILVLIVIFWLYKIINKKMYVFKNKHKNNFEFNNIDTKDEFNDNSKVVDVDFEDINDKK